MVRVRALETKAKAKTQLNKKHYQHQIKTTDVAKLNPRQIAECPRDTVVFLVDDQRPTTLVFVMDSI